MYSLMLEVEEIDHKMPNLSDEEKFTSSQRRETLLEQLFRLTGAKTPGETWKKLVWISNMFACPDVSTTCLHVRMYLQHVCMS